MVKQVVMWISKIFLFGCDLQMSFFTHTKKNNKESNALIKSNFIVSVSVAALLAFIQIPPSFAQNKVVVIPLGKSASMDVVVVRQANATRSGPGNLNKPLSGKSATNNAL
ncbi:MAG: hypothetical protein KJ990_00815 [Proteobacteria bacterium]|nr:hypothetical protein [Pseudomonadota bacterium]MBU1648839.1 hypothetical protein [Pseudomonadota bacterium]